MKPTAKQVYELIKKRFAPPAWATFSEVSDGTGANIARYADAIAMSIWPSRGYNIEGFEIKVSRGDWLKELNSPEKSYPIQRFCNAWWIVAGDETVVKAGELPKTWGLMVVKGDKLRVHTAAPKLKPDRLEPAFVASIIRRQYQCQAAFVQDEIDAALGNRVDARQVAQREANNLQARVRDLEYENKRLQGSLNDFERVSGIKIDQWNGRRLGEIVNDLREVPKQPRILEWFQNAETHANNTLMFVRKQREQLEALAGCPPQGGDHEPS